MNSKEAIKTALEIKGVDMTDVKFSEFASKIASISAAGGHDIVLGLDFNESAIYGSGSNRSSDGSYNTIYSYVYLNKHAMSVSKVYWDVLAGTYQLRINDELVGEETATGTETLEFEVDIDLIAFDGPGPNGSHKFHLTKTGAAVQMRDGPLAINGAFFLPTYSYFNSTAYDYQIPIKLEGMITAKTLL